MTKASAASTAATPAWNWTEDYGVQGGRCNTDTVLTAARAPSGGAVIGNRTASPENRDDSHHCWRHHRRRDRQQDRRQRIDDRDSCLHRTQPGGGCRRQDHHAGPIRRPACVQHAAPHRGSAEMAAAASEYRGRARRLQPAIMTACRTPQATWVIRQRITPRPAGTGSDQRHRHPLAHCRRAAHS